MCIRDRSGGAGPSTDKFVRALADLIESDILLRNVCEKYEYLRIPKESKQEEIQSDLKRRLEAKFGTDNANEAYTALKLTANACAIAGTHRIWGANEGNSEMLMQALYKNVDQPDFMRDLLVVA